MSRREETSVTERSSATKRPAGEEEEGGDEEEIVEGPKKKISFGLSKPKGTAGLVMPAKKPLAAISIKLGQAQKAPVQPVVKPKVGAAASVFSAEDDENSEEEMPPEAKMRMKNIGRDTPTSAGPNSFGKTRMGFCDSKKIYEKQLP
ncbi:hypothetical protein Pmani_027879 [Petrolisthes manimaculis]|uniref:PEST proteolytic signal-containing nuclear protein n=1 Tax=Petrolisthes manimaculis TaxID=1843537 RepID=A0AAE1P172_9EUCA|nr:hypothetical protein Pmani_027879 [Petrolisthes manimaculis]